jgi:hypothetical protein
MTCRQIFKISCKFLMKDLKIAKHSGLPTEGPA